MSDPARTPLRVLVVGAGMYVCGRGTPTYGTVLPSLFQAAREGLVGSVTVCAAHAASMTALRQKNKELTHIFDLNLPLRCFPEQGYNPQAYQMALDREHYDCALVVIPDHLHYEVCRDIISRNIHLLVVKPFTPECRTAQELIELARARGVYGAVEFHKRYDEANIKIRDMLQDAAPPLSGRRYGSLNLGHPEYFIVEYSQRKIIPDKLFADWVERTDIFQYLGVHYVDLIHFLTGALPERVLSIGQKEWLKSRGVDAYDAMQTMIEWSCAGRRFTSTHFTNWIDPNKTSAMSDQSIKLIASGGRIESNQKKRGFQIVSDEEGIEDFNPYFSQFYGDIDNRQKVFAGYGYKGFRQFLQDVADLKAGAVTVDRLRRGGGRPTFESALVSTAVIEASRTSLCQGNGWCPVDQEMLARYHGCQPDGSRLP